jgi:uncharacterized protein (TIGR02246 family)
VSEVERSLALMDAVRRLVAAWNRRDAHAFASAFTPDATYVTGGGHRVRGRAPIAALVSGDRGASRIEVVDEPLTEVGRTTATVRFGWSTAGDAGVVRRGTITCTLARRDVGWLIESLHNEETVANELRIEPIRASGPVGTGVHVLRRTPGPSGAAIADVWWTVLFVPVLPLGEWTLQPREASARSWAVTHVARPRPLKAVARVAAGALAAVSSLLPAYAGVTFFTGTRPVELGGLFASAAAIVGALGWLDESCERVRFVAALRVLAGRKGPEAG